MKTIRPIAPKDHYTSGDGIRTSEPTPQRATNLCVRSARDDKMPDTEHGHAFVQSQSHSQEPITTSSRKSAASCETRLERARPHVVLLASCLVYLTTALLAFQISILSISNLKLAEYKRVDDEFRAHSSALRKEKIVYTRLNDLRSTQLRRTLMETYEECLVRGLNEANYELIGLGFQYPDVREQVMEWAMEECGRLQYSPQVVNEKTTPQEAVVTYWASVSYRARRIAEETVEFIKQKLGWVFSRLTGSSHHEEAPLQTDNATANEVMHTDEPVFPKRPLPSVPFGFALQCQAGQPCRLVYSGDSTMHITPPHVSPEFLAKLWEQRNDLLVFGSTLDWFGKRVATVSRAVYYFETIFHFLCILMYAPIVANSLITKNYSLIDHPNEEMIYLIKYLILEHVTSALLSLLDKKPRIFPSMKSALPFAFVFTSIGVNMISKLFIPGSQLETFFNMHVSLRSLYSIIRDSDKAEEENSSTTSDRDGKQESRNNSPNTEIPSPGNAKALDAAGVCPPSKPHHRLANPETTIEQDIEHTRQILRQEREPQAVDDRADIHADLETDSESDSDGDDDDAFVHIVGHPKQEVPTTEDVPAWLMM